MPNDTATAAINIAKNPLSNVSAIYNLPTGNVPFSPELTSVPNDLSVGISYTWPGIQKPQAIAVDGYGVVWITEDNTPTLTALVPYLPATSALAYFQQLSSQFSPMDMTIGPNSLISILDVIASDGAGYVYLGSTPPTSIFKTVGTTGAIANTPATEPLTGSTTCLGGQSATHMAIDSLANGYNLWISSENGDVVCVVNTSSTGALVHQIVINSAQSSGSYSPEVIAIDALGSAWIPNQRSSTLSRITQGGVLTNPTGGTLSNPYGVAVDGAGSVFIANRGNNGISEYANTGTAVSAVNLQAGGTLSDPLNLAVDLAGNLWITNYTGNKIVEMVGVATPTYAPLSVAASVNKLGSKP
jgi:streptogramin lyase